MNPSPLWGFDAVRAAMRGDGSRVPLVALVLGLLFLIPGIIWKAPAMTVVGAVFLVLWIVWTASRMRSLRRARRLSARSNDEDARRVGDDARTSRDG